ncbi:protein dispatched homolog 1 isoform X2 [Octodon degus]|nr:protein dispatched homolog 1 isoform X2 [Octodon degus]
MSLSPRRPDFAFLSNGSIAPGASKPSAPGPREGDASAAQPGPTDAVKAKAHASNGCLHRNGMVKSSFLPLDSQRVPQPLAQRCLPCPYHHLPSSHLETGLAVPSTLASCCSEHSAALCASRSPACPAPCCLQPSPSFCLHQPWPDHFQQQPAPPHIAGLRPPRPFKLPKSYAALLADWPVVVLGLCTLLIVVCALVGVLVLELPDFSDPLLGFEPRGTTIGQRLVTWNNMVKNTGYKATLANYPFKYADEQAKSHRDDRWSDDHYEREKRDVDWNFHTDSFFCDVPSERYSRVVFTSAGGETLWSLSAIQSMCRIDNSRIRSHPQFGDLCQRTTAASCCPSWTLGNYIAILNNRSSCQNIVERDVSHTLKLLRTCAKHYQNGTLGPDCWDAAARRKDQLKCTSVPRRCTKHNAVYQILHYLVDKDFIAPRTAGHAPPALKHSMLFSPTEKGKSMMNIYLDNFENWNSSDGVTAVTGIEFGIKHSLFQDYLLMDTVYPAIAIGIVLLVMCVYTRSMFITLMTMFAILSSLIVSYFLYRVVFSFEFFPFMNLTALIILVGIGADDAFVLCDVWTYTKCDKPHAETAETVSTALQHAALSMFVTSFTTAAAFYANYVSKITAIRCFGVYAGTAILVNYILMVTWLPAAVVLHERYLLNSFSCFRKPQQPLYDDKSCWTVACQKCHQLLMAISETSRIFFEKVLPCIVIKFRYLWLLWFLALTVGGAYIVCVNPKMKLPSLELSEFQVFRASHPFERYDAEYKKQFMFERVHHGEELHMPITVVWGVSPEDNGNPLNPKSKGKLTLDSSFNIASPASQAWILHFCQKLRNQTFFHQTDEQDFTSCFIETFKQWMENQDCDEPALYPCCSHWSFPYKQEVFELCIKRAIMELERSTGYHLDSRTPGPRFDVNDTIRAVVLEFQSAHLFTLAYEKMHQFYSEVDAWISRELRSAPEGLGNGWFVSNLEFYDLQDSLSDGTLIAMGLSVAVAFSVMLLTTRNAVISLYAIVSIAGTIFVTVGSLVLLGWELNVLESVTISVAVGLSVDFAVHYGVAYRLAPDPDREGKVTFSLSRMGSAIAMAALTTFVAGAMMMPSTVLAYTQLGTFMMLVMCVSWAFATFFFQCMCRCLGPQGSCGQIPLPRKLQCSSFTHTLSPEPGGQSKARPEHAYHLEPQDQKPEGEQEFYELEPLASQNHASEKIVPEETYLCAELLGSPAGRSGVPWLTACAGEQGQSSRADSSTALLPPCPEPHRTHPFFSLNQRCCPHTYRLLTCSPHSYQQGGDTTCGHCSPAAGGIVQTQNRVAPLQAPQQAPEGFVHHLPHLHPHNCPCLQGCGKPPTMQSTPPRNCCPHQAPRVQVPEHCGKAGATGRPDSDPQAMGQSPLACRGLGCDRPAHCHAENNQRGLHGDRDLGHREGSRRTKSRVSGLQHQNDRAEERAELSLSQAGAAGDSGHFSHSEPELLLNRFLGEARRAPGPGSPQSCRSTVRERRSSIGCQPPRLVATVPAVLMHSELAGESLLIKTL